MAIYDHGSNFNDARKKGRTRENEKNKMQT